MLWRTLVKAFVWILILLGVLFGVGLIFFKTRVAPDDSMAPNVLQGDKFLLCYRCDIERGDPVLCDHPRLPGVQIMGRVVGVEGDKVEVRQGNLRVNDAEKPIRSDGKPYEWDGLHDPNRTYLIWYHNTLYGEIVDVLYPEDSVGRLPDQRPETVRPGHLFLMGDNRRWNLSWMVDGKVVPGGGCNSSFSCGYGQVPRDKCHGVIYFTYSAAERGAEGSASARSWSFVK